jgi:hypothetical protein
MVSGCVESIYRSYILCFWPDYEPKNCFTNPNKNIGREGGLTQINTCRQIPLQVDFKEKIQPVGFGVFLVIWSMPLCVSYLGR